MEQNLDRLTELLQKRLFVELEASGRHVHVTMEQAMTLFGHGLTEKRPLSQPGQYLAEERVTVRGPKGTFTHVAVLGPCRKEGQVELSVTDALALGVDQIFAARFGKLRIPESTYLSRDDHGQMTASQWADALRKAVDTLDAKAKRLPIDKLIGK